MSCEKKILFFCSFFIDHATKKTTWVDPRSPEGRHQVAVSITLFKLLTYIVNSYAL